MYEKTSSPPKAGSLRDALFLHVWLRRQEIEVAKSKILAQGLADVVAASGGKSENIVSVFKEFTAAIFPFSAKAQTTTDQVLIEKMKKEADKGPIMFSPINTNVLKAAAKKMSMPDDFRQKLLDAKANRTGRR